MQAPFTSMGDSGQKDPHCDTPSTDPWTGLAQRQTWDLDGVGNWSKFGVKVDDVSTSERRLDTSFNEYYDLGGVSQSHDDNGNLTDDGTREMAWDAWNRLRSVSDGVNTLGEYLYDTGNRRVRVDVGQGDWIVDFVYDGWKEIQQFEDDNASGHYGDLMRQYVYGGFIDERLSLDIDADNDGNAIESNGDDTRYFYLQNTLYSTYALTDEDGNVVEAYEYAPYGKATLITDGNDYDAFVNFTTNDARDVGGLLTLPTTGNFFWFTGRYFDQHSGLQNSRNRYYDAVRGRFVGRDPIGIKGGKNGYCYVNGDPNSNIDPSGLEATRYSCNCGWLNLGHANPKNATSLIADIKSANGLPSLLGGGFKVSFAERQYLGPISNKAQMDYYVNDNLQGKEIEVALGIFKEVSVRFEELQASQSIFGNKSGFHEGDLPSDLMGFYIAAGRTTSADLFGQEGSTFTGGLCDVLTQKQSAEILKKQKGLGHFPYKWGPTYRDSCGHCCNEPKWPELLTKIQEEPKGPLYRDWKYGIKVIGDFFTRVTGVDEVEFIDVEGI